MRKPTWVHTPPDVNDTSSASRRNAEFQWKHTGTLPFETVISHNLLGTQCITLTLHTCTWTFNFPYYAAKLFVGARLSCSCAAKGDTSLLMQRERPRTGFGNVRVRGWRACIPGWHKERFRTKIFESKVLVRKSGNNFFLGKTLLWLHNFLSYKNNKVACTQIFVFRTLK